MESHLLSRLMARRRIAGCAVLSNSKYAVTLDADRPVVLSWRSLVTGDLLFGDPDGQEPVFTVWSEADGQYRSSRDAGVAVAYRVRRDGSSVTYHATVTKDGGPLVELDIGLALSDDELTVSFGNCVEHRGCRFMHVDLPRLASAHSVQGSSRMVIGSNAGRLVNPARCEGGDHYHKYSWVREAFGTVGLVYNTGLTAVVMLDSLDDTLLSSVKGNCDGRFAGLGVQFRYRYPSSDPSLQFAPRESSRMRVRLIAAPTGSPEKGWVVGARYLQGLHTSRSARLYQDAFIYKIFIGCPGAPKETTFDEALALIRRIHDLTDGARQIAYLVGFQHEGHDTGYPDVFTVNETAGGMSRLQNLMSEAAKLNANVSFHDNYDDAYQASPAWDPDDISVNPGGGLLKGGVWNGVQAYWISMPVYAAKKAPERVRRTLAQYPIRETYHLDVLTASVFRVDYRAAGPTGKGADHQARLKIVEEFRNRGIDVTSEGCGLPFIDHIGYFWHLPRPKEQVFAGDRRIPFAPFIAHGHVNYGGSSPDEPGIADALLYGAFYSQDLKTSTPLKEILDAFYLLQVPLNLLRGELMVDYDEDGPRKKIAYSEGSSVEVDFESLEHEVCIRGRRVVKDFVCFAPGTKRGAHCYYRAREGPEIPWRLPEEWKDARRLRAVPLTVSGEGEPAELAAADGMVTFNLPVGVPFRVTAWAGP